MLTGSGIGRLFLRRGVGVAGLVIALAGLVPLSGALRIPDGIPSPAARLADHPPWEGVSDPAEGNANLIDVTYQIQPWLIFLRREMRQGRLPFWNPHQFAGTPFWANGQSAGFFPLHLVFVALPLRLGFLLLPWLRFLIAGLGAWALGRRLGLGEPGALIAGLIFPLSGMLMSFLLFPMGNALALIPWVLWSVDRLAESAEGDLSEILPLAVFSGLQLLSGHPETPVHTAMLSALYLLVRGARLGVWGRWVAGWVVGAALAAVQILPLALHLLASTRWQEMASVSRPPVVSILPPMLRAVLPDVFGSASAGTWWGPFNDAATAVYAGALTLPLAVAGAVRARGDRRWLAIAAVVGFSFLVAYHLPGLWDLLAHLPVIGRAAQHRLIFGVELGAALLAGAGVERWLADRGGILQRGWISGAALAVAPVAVAWGFYRSEWSERGLLGRELGWSLWVVGAAVLLVVALGLSVHRRRRLWPLIPALLVLDLALAHAPINPGLSLAKLYPETGATVFLAGKEGRLAGVGSALRPNACLVYGCRDLRGDDPVKLQRFEEVYRRLAPTHPVYYRPLKIWRSDLLDRLSVRWVVSAPDRVPDQGAQEPSWRLAYEGADARVWERPSAEPLVRWADDRPGFEVSVEESRPGLWRLRYEAPAPGTLVVAESWDPGWRAKGGTRGMDVREVKRAGDLFLGIPLEAGSGEVVLEYRPPGFAVGAGASLIAMATVFLLAVVAARRRARVVCDNPVAE